MWPHRQRQLLLLTAAVLAAAAVVAACPACGQLKDTAEARKSLSTVLHGQDTVQVECSAAATPREKEGGVATCSDNSTSVSGSASCTPALAFIASGVTAAEPLFLNALVGVAAHSQWQGPVFVVTDAPECLKAQLQESTHSAMLQRLDLHFLQVPPPREFAASSRHHTHTTDGRINVRRQRMQWVLQEIKVYKMRVFKLLRENGFVHVTHVLFVDADAIVGAPIQPLVDFVNVL